ncbi:MAG: hypothetical protein ACREBR_03555, partial [bacterium]
VKFVDTSAYTDAVVSSFVEKGFPEWQAKGMIELYGLGKLGYLKPGEGAKALSGSEAMHIEPLIEKYKDAFPSSQWRNIGLYSFIVQRVCNLCASCTDCRDGSSW